MYALYEDAEYTLGKEKKNMGKVTKRVMTAVLVMLLVLGGGSIPQSVGAKTEYNTFQNKWSVEDSGVGFVTKSKPVEDLDSGYLVQPNDNIYLVAPSGTNGGKVVSVKSSNTKIATVKDAAKGWIKVNNTAGSTWISYTITYSCRSKHHWEYHKSIAGTYR